ncbi:unnamed protein product [Camellia sinensis]
MGTKWVAWESSGGKLLLLLNRCKFYKVCKQEAMAGFLVLQWLESWGLGNVLVCTDSELLVKGLLGKMMAQIDISTIVEHSKTMLG